MVGRYRRTADGWSVETVRLSTTPDHHDGEWIRIRRFGFWIKDVRSVEELAELVPLADLEPYGLGRHCEPGALRSRFGRRERCHDGRDRRTGGPALNTGGDVRGGMSPLRCVSSSSISRVARIRAARYARTPSTRMPYASNVLVIFMLQLGRSFGLRAPGGLAIAPLSAQRG
jgi:hypothetical protein